MAWWGWIIVALIIFIIILFLIDFSDKEKKCAWCDGTEIKFKNGKEGDWFWEYRNKDGSRDKRVKDNFQQAGYRSEFECNECSATTKFSHFVSKTPNHDVTVWKRTLVTKGNNDREGTDWENSSTKTIQTKQPNRKN